MQAIFEIQAATNAARSRLNDGSLATRVEAGKIQVVRVTYPDGSKSVVTPVSDWMPIADVCQYLQTIQ